MSPNTASSDATKPSAPRVEEATGSSLQAGHTVGGGRFRLERAIGRGGMGTVWLAFDERLNERVALKFISERIRENPASLAAMRLETSRSHSLSHHHIVRIHDLHEAAGEPAFISMEYIEGANFYELARKRENHMFPWQEVWRWLQQLCAALGYAHSRGVIHRDLKPANLMLDSAGDLKLADFGLAAAIKDAEEAGDRKVSGTLAYMSPQQLGGAPPAVTDDIYSLGACLFELLTGLPVFRGADIRSQIEFEPAPLLSAALGERGREDGVPEGIEDLVLQCLSKNPQSRPQSALALLELASANSGEPAPAGARDRTRAPRNRPGRRWLPASRTSLLILAGGCCAALLFALARPSPARYPISGTLLDLRNATVRGSSHHDSSTPEGAFDGRHREVAVRDGYRWASSTFVGDTNEWIAVDLGRDRRISSIGIDWELAFAKNFSVRTRTGAEGFDPNPARWAERGSVTGFRELWRAAVNETNHIDDVVFDFARNRVGLGRWMAAQGTAIAREPVIARHVMIEATARGPNNLGVYSIFEVEISEDPSWKQGTSEVRTNARP